jgi:plastocyanin
MNGINEGGTVSRSIRSRLGVMVAVLAIGAFGLAAPVQAEDLITGQDHPADVSAQAFNYLPPTVTVSQGQSITFGNYDMYPYGAGIAAHSLTETVEGCTGPPYEKCDRYPRFSTALTDHGYVHKVEGVENLPPGSYPFSCQMHSQMTGTLVVQ